MANKAIKAKKKDRADMANNPLHAIKSITEPDMFFTNCNLQSFHLHSGGVSRFTKHAMSWRGSFRTIIAHGPSGSKTIRIWLKRE